MVLSIDGFFFFLFSLSSLISFPGLEREEDSRQPRLDLMQRKVGLLAGGVAIRRLADTVILCIRLDFAERSGLAGSKARAGQSLLRTASKPSSRSNASWLGNRSAFLRGLPTRTDR
jgi:hypothetical protein